MTTRQELYELVWKEPVAQLHSRSGLLGACSIPGCAAGARSSFIEFRALKHSEVAWSYLDNTINELT